MSTLTARKQHSIPVSVSTVSAYESPLPVLGEIKDGFYCYLINNQIRMTGLELEQETSDLYDYENDGILLGTIVDKGSELRYRVNTFMNIATPAENKAGEALFKKINEGALTYRQLVQSGVIVSMTEKVYHDRLTELAELKQAKKAIIPTSEDEIQRQIKEKIAAQKMRDAIKAEKRRQQALSIRQRQEERINRQKAEAMLKK